MRTLRILVCISLLSTLALAQFHPSNLRRGGNGANNAVRDYLRLDLDGARLQPEGWERLKALTTWKHNPDWQAFTIVSQYEVVNSSESSRSGLVTVKYGVLGRFEIGVGYSADPSAEMVDFKVRESDDGWKIEEQTPTLNPHVSRARAVQWLQAALASEKDAVHKVAIEKALAALQPKAETKN